MKLAQQALSILLLALNAVPASADWGQRPHYKNLEPNVTIQFGLSSLNPFKKNSKVASLPECGGTIEVKAGLQDVVMKFQGVERCANFDILSANGERVHYRDQRLNLDHAGYYTGTFRLPKRLIDEGGNSVKIIIQSNSGRRDDVVRIKFLSL